MASKTNIEWTQMTWNPITGCTKVSQGCKHCYAERMAKRLQAMGVKRYRNGFKLTLHEDLIELPFRWREPRLIFVNSMSDLFHEEVPLEFIQRVFKTMVKCPHHIFQILTKRSKRAKEISPALPWPANVWMGTSVEDSRVTSRIKDLQKIPAKIRFLSCEPLIGPLDNLPLDGIHWVIVGGESGPGARPMRIEWVDSILTQCRKKRVHFFFKQWGGVRKDLTGRILHGRTYNEMPSRNGNAALPVGKKSKKIIRLDQQAAAPSSRAS
ncbi:phage Gp37/Gp68 family protein [Candidatus Acetothermia bacterium]|nr:phage Gp37/Gp68 family protein [Candidatus Acetothermia bacterium]